MLSLRMLLSAALVLNPFAATVASAQTAPFAQAFRPNANASTRTSKSDATDWIVEAAARKYLGDNARALELFTAARERLEAEQLPEPYAEEIHNKLNKYVVSAGGQATPHTESPDIPSLPLPDTSGTKDNTTTTTADADAKTDGAKTDKPGTNTDTLPSGSPFTDPVPANVANNNLIANSIRLDDIGDPLVQTVRPQEANLLIASRYLTLHDLELLMKDGNLRSLLWWINTARIAFYSKDNNLRQVIQRKVSPTDLNQLDSFRNNFGMGSYSDVSMGPLADLLTWFGLYNKDFTTEAKVLIQNFDGSRLSELADRYIWDGIKTGALLGAAFAFVPNTKKLGPTIGMNSQMGGGFSDTATAPGIAKVGSNELASMYFNAKYMFRIAALYGIPLDDSDKQMLALVVFAVAKGLMRYHFTRHPEQAKTAAKSIVGPLKRTLTKMGADFAKAKRGNRGKQWLMGTLERLVAKEQQTQINLPNIPIPGNAGTVKGKVTDPLPGDEPGGDPTKPKKPRAPKKPETTKAKLLRFAGVLGRTARGAFTDALIAAVSGEISKTFFEGMYQGNVRLQNKSFLRLMNSEKGFAFLKILIQSMYAEQETINPVDMKNPSTQFIMNFARAMGMCSAQDYAKIRSSAGVLKADIELRKLRYSCKSTRPDTYYYDLLMRELLTFNALKTKSVARLRASVLRDRLKMAQLLIEFQYMDGHRSQDEIDFFDDVTSKILGITSSDQKQFLDAFDGYVKQAGGMTPASGSLAGFAVKKSREASSYDFNLLPTPIDSPSEVLAVDLNDTTDTSTSGSFGGSTSSSNSPF